ncbi:MAG: hypothetical protein ACLS7Z_02410 [Christensenellales bacterium]
MSKTEIVGVIGRQVLDSRGNPTVEAEVQLSGGVVCTAISPSGASTGKYEALELRDGDMQVYGGKGVQQACKNISGAICKALCGMDAGNLFASTMRLCWTAQKQGRARRKRDAGRVDGMRKGGGLRAGRFSAFWAARRRTDAHAMMNILNGGVHAGNGLDVQEFMIVPVGAKDFRAALQMGADYHALAALKEGLSTAWAMRAALRGDCREKQALDLILDAFPRGLYRRYGYRPRARRGGQRMGQKGRYVLPKSGRTSPPA